jgi:hypothetical protein
MTNVLTAARKVYRTMMKPVRNAAACNRISRAMLVR